MNATSNQENNSQCNTKSIKTTQIDENDYNL